VCSVQWDEDFKYLRIIGRRLWRVQSQQDDKILHCQWLNPFSFWRSTWSAINRNEYRFVYRITIDGCNLQGFARSFIDFDEAKNVTGFAGDYYILPPGRPDWGTIEFRQRQTIDPTRDDVLWEGMELV
jgi:hypothetical protein